MAKINGVTVATTMKPSEVIEPGRIGECFKTKSAFAVGWGNQSQAREAGVDFNAFEVYANTSYTATSGGVGEYSYNFGMKLGQTTLTEDDLKSMLSILTNDLSEVTY